MLREVLIAVAQSTAPLTSRQVADAIGLDYEQNFNKREMKYARKLQGFVVKRRLTAEEMETPTTLTHWFLADQWKGHTLDDILKAFDAAGLQADRETTLERIESHYAQMNAKLDEINAKMDLILVEVRRLAALRASAVEVQ